MANIFGHALGAQEELAKQKRKEAGEKEPEPEKTGPTLQEIMATDSELFGLYIEKHGSKDLADRVIANTVTEDDLGELKKSRIEFVRIQEQVRQMEGMLSDEVLKAMADKSPKTKELTDAFGVREVSAAYLHRISELAITDPGKFQTMQRLFEKLQGGTEFYTEEDKKVRVICKRYGISPEEYTKAIYSDNPRDLEKLVLSKMSFMKQSWQKYVNTTGFHSDIASIDRRGDIDRLQAKYNNDLREVAEAMSMTVAGSEAMRGSLMRTMKGEQLDKGEGIASMKELQGFRAWANDPDNKEIEEGWEAFKKANSAGDVEKNKQKYLDSVVKNKLKGKGGLWAKLAALFFKGSSFTNRLK